jgi:hypothetical protein
MQINSIVGIALFLRALDNGQYFMEYFNSMHNTSRAQNSEVSTQRQTPGPSKQKSLNSVASLDPGLAPFSLQLVSLYHISPTFKRKINLSDY